MIIDVVMPKMGESITEGTILEWRKQVGDKIELDEILLEIGTDKVDSEIPSSASGVIIELLAKPNDVIEVGKVIAKIDSKKHAEELSADSKKLKDKKFFSPVVMKIVAENQLSLTELEKIPGTGRSGRVTKKDVLRYISQNEDSKSYNFIESGDLTQESKVISSNEEEMSHMRQMISRHMIDSLSTSAHVHVMTDVDMSRIVEFVRMNETDFKVQESYNLTYTPFVVKATVQALL